MYQDFQIDPKEQAFYSLQYAMEILENEYDNTEAVREMLHSLIEDALEQL